MNIGNIIISEVQTVCSLPSIYVHGASMCNRTQHTNQQLPIFFSKHFLFKS